ncbi:phosphate ABC transporter substrate-binding protein [Limosilactobacillus sp. RRLNB_1_1]|uniref:Phosphate-binding protein n=1 Tax=Limosilactobacillus albertensis TaxID=2759752 RepID=A0A7W3TQ43_9LACO|nr:phosphate ABC transporter substrate-binding protein [Limosilactobacillus albertensis]MBB1068805.1 phosphate ABC transporter substrate-binding protein [Limosilactobacillus albertensis]MCD7118511.1 phosphate ABC transporter substrate-binding protein [Limosilactobacillus albertensis]MCD7127594.1 phosphate ABC transporter substrate-binding protein [Limosilactobacillus albertensis]
MKKIVISIVLLVMGCWLGGSWVLARQQPAQEKITIVGSTALQPLAEAVANDYRTNHPHTSIIVQGGGSGTGLSQVQAGAVNIGSADIFADQQDGINARKLNDNIVAVSGIVPIVNEHLGVKNLTMDQLRQIFTGQITNWQELGGPDLPITVINRAHGSGTRVAFEQTVLKPGMQAVNAQEQDSNGTVKEIIKNTPGAISYIAFAYLNDQVQAINLDGVAPTAANVTTNKWQLWSYEHMYTQKHPSRATTEFIKYMQSEKVQKTLVTDAHYISIHDMKVEKTPNGKVTERK